MEEKLKIVAEKLKGMILFPKKIERAKKALKNIKTK
jgi:hypothetical protein